MNDYKRGVSINYEVVEVIHKSSTWGNIVLKVKHKDKLYILKCFPKIICSMVILKFKP